MFTRLANMINIVYLSKLDDHIFSENLSPEADGDP